MSQIKDIFSKFPVIELDEEYILREQTIDDAESFYKYYTDPKVSKYILSYMPVSVEDAKEEVKYWIDYFKHKKGVYWGIAKKDNNELIGSIGFTHWIKQYNRAELSYDLAKEYWNKGIMTKAIKKVLKFGFEEMGLNRIQCFMIKNNPASERILLKRGFVKEGILRQDRFSKGEYWDVNVYALLKKDYE
ncbi:GNAT family N-acetyltransferase [Pseudomonadota bacterium]